MLNLANELNEQQLEAAAHVRGPLLVIAGAGSGKTRVITFRIANLVLNHGVEPWRILAVTFTNKAAKEMKERVEQLLEHGAKCWISTFHATCARLLRTYAADCGVDPSFTIYDDGDQKAMVVRCLKDLQLDDKQFPPRALQNEINRAKQELISPEEYPRGDFYRERIGKVFDLYEQRMRESKALDFGDLLYRTVRAMRKHEELARTIAGRFDYVLVDEFQDTNRAQLEIVRQLGRPHGNVCVVGDDDQSIYSWRGADVSNILDFERHFAGAKVVTLDRNYRSTANILKAAHGVVSLLPGRRPKKMWTSAAAGEHIMSIESEDEREEARAVAKAVRELKDGGIPYSQQAVFYRINAQSRVFEEVLRTFGIPHRVVGGMRFYERAEVKDVLAYLRLVQNPGDLAAFLRVVNTPARGIGKVTIDKLLALAAGHGVSAYEAIGLVAAEIGAAPAQKLEAFRTLVETWRIESELGPAHVASRVLQDTGYVAALETENSAEADARLENLKELVGSIADFEAEAETPTLESFLELVVLQTDVDAARFDDDQVTLMTVHAAKGLEFDAVHVTGLEEGLFPYVRQGSLEDTPADLAEERRLCYVAMTRARKRLFLHRARLRHLFGQTKGNPPSRFLADVPAELLEHKGAPRPDVRALEPAAGRWSGGYGRGASNEKTTHSGPVVHRAPSSYQAQAKPGRVTSETWVDRSFDQTSPCGGIQVGQQVRHVRFGVGQVVALVPGAKLKVDVKFPVYGIKTIMADYLEVG